MKFRELFGKRKPVIGMLHLKGDGARDMLRRAQEEARIYLECGVEALLVENYFGSTADCETVLRWLRDELPDAIYGVNILGDFPSAFRLSDKYGAKFIQIDSVCGHLPPDKDAAYAKRLDEYRRDSGAVLLGGVRFKYQPVRSGRTLEEDLQLGERRCDAIVVTGAGTGIPTPAGKVAEFREVLGDFPLVIGAGVTQATVQDTFSAGDGAIVGSWFKQGHRDTGDVAREYVQAFMEEKRRCCGEDVAGVV